MGLVGQCGVHSEKPPFVGYILYCGIVYCSSRSLSTPPTISDLRHLLAERRYRSWRRPLWSLLDGPDVLAIGVGTGKNMRFYAIREDVRPIASGVSPH